MSDSLAHDLLTDRERLRAAATWRGVAVQLRSGAERALRALSSRQLRLLGRALSETPVGFVVMVHTKACRRRDDRCRCAGVRLEVGARA